MKKWIFPLLLGLGLTGCSQNQTGTIGAKDSGSTTKQENQYSLSGEVNDPLIIDAPDQEITIHLDHVDMDTQEACIQIVDAKKATIVLDGDNTLKDGIRSVSSEEETANAAIYATCPLVFEGEGSVSIVAGNHGIYSNDTITIQDGAYSIEAENDGIKGKDGVVIEDGSIAIRSNDHGIASTKNKAGVFGSILVHGGAITLDAQGDGLHCTGEVKIDGGELSIDSKQEGIEGYQVFLDGGKTTISVRDDGINASDPTIDSSQSMDPFASSSSSCSIVISNGEHTISAQGDGLDSNGSLRIEGGKTFVFGPENGGNFALDYNGEGSFEGGTLVATGMSGMVEALSSNTPFLSLNTRTQNANKTVDLTLDGKSFLTFEPTNAWNVLLVYDATFKEGDTIDVLNQEVRVSTRSEASEQMRDPGQGRPQMGMGQRP